MFFARVTDAGPIHTMFSSLTIVSLSSARSSVSPSSQSRRKVDKSCHKIVVAKKLTGILSNLVDVLCVQGICCQNNNFGDILMSVCLFITIGIKHSEFFKERPFFIFGASVSARKFFKSLL